MVNSVDCDSLDVGMRDYMMHHETYSAKELNDVKVTHKKFESWHDRVAYAAVRTLRFFFDTFTGYVHRSQQPSKDMTEEQWLRRFIFLETVAGVPGMVAGMSRHMKSLRKWRYRWKGRAISIIRRYDASRSWVDSYAVSGSRE